MFFRKLTILLLVLSVASAVGCEIMPVNRYKPTLHNPFPQLKSVAVVPFQNLAQSSRVDGREFAKCYGNELQRVPGFVVVADELVERAMLMNELHRLETVDDIRLLGQILKVDVVVIGKIHDFTNYYPPRAKFQVEWYAVNPYLHPIPIGYGLPWGTPQEADIPDKILLLSEMEIASAQIATQTPEFAPVRRGETESPQYPQLQQVPSQQQEQPKKEAKKENPIKLVGANLPTNIPNGGNLDETQLSQVAEYKQKRFVDDSLLASGIPYVPDGQPISPAEKKEKVTQWDPLQPHPLQYGPWPTPWTETNQLPLAQQNQQNPGTYEGHYPGYPQPPNLTPEQLAQYGWANQPVPPIPPYYSMMPGMAVDGQPGMVMGEPDRFPGLPKDWPDPRGLIPEGPEPERPVRKVKNDGPVLFHINVYNGNDSEFMQALQDYDFLFRDDKRIASKQSILNNRSEFISFCCRLHIWEMLSARGGAGRAEKVVREWKLWYGGKKPY